ncbi:hypothetical protein [Microbacterium imperiale]|uniref:PH domain-containing protein n=1 Tax=Microbacterium imperiale TaxID=33884 RepID=A0A9W6HFS6_9MICO|nr:hypothetical protein [Microbacterium imperiale]MBP2422125.1 hypothetical protein [Microbacterium imperiale]MDS0200284.1 hypothetical protein [Microbacterium imperiale]BFE39447.1 hypothetical protein GCM10017544_04030 [Microbacterium imperiale]GLJ79686.1 hypothetical protein GCM10017586_13680 [Microbacterium imperiale]
MQRNEASADDALREVRRALRAVGRVPRVISSIVALVMLAASSVPVMADRDMTGLIVVGVPSVISVMLAFRVRAALGEDDVLLITGYVRSSRIALREVHAFVDVPYAGWWNGFAGSDGWTNFGLRMLEIELRGGRAASLPESICSGRRTTSIADLLNSWADERSPLNRRAAVED